MKTSHMPLPMYWQFLLFFVGNVDFIHMHRLHTGDQPYPCTACGEGFRTKAELNQHNRATHGGLNPNSANTTIVVSGSQQQMVSFQERNRIQQRPYAYYPTIPFIPKVICQSVFLKQIIPNKTTKLCIRIIKTVYSMFIVFLNRWRGSINLKR